MAPLQFILVFIMCLAIDSNCESTNLTTTYDNSTLTSTETLTYNSTANTTTKVVESSRCQLDKPFLSGNDCKEKCGGFIVSSFKIEKQGGYLDLICTDETLNDICSALIVIALVALSLAVVGLSLQIVRLKRKRTTQEPTDEEKPKEVSGKKKIIGIKFRIPSKKNPYVPKPQQIGDIPPDPDYPVRSPITFHSEPDNVDDDSGTQAVETTIAEEDYISPDAEHQNTAHDSFVEEDYMNLNVIQEAQEREGDEDYLPMDSNAKTVQFINSQKRVKEQKKSMEGLGKKNHMQKTAESSGNTMSNTHEQNKPKSTVTLDDAPAQPMQTGRKGSIVDELKKLVNTKGQGISEAPYSYTPSQRTPQVGAPMQSSAYADQSQLVYDEEQIYQNVPGC